MTESAAIIWLADAHPPAALSPPVDSPIATDPRLAAFWAKRSPFPNGWEG